MSRPRSSLSFRGACSTEFQSVISLCYSDLPESELTSNLEAIIRSCPNLRHHSKELLGNAVRRRSPAFCKLIIEMNPGLSSERNTLFHDSCYYANFETAKYFLDLCPESINIPMRNGLYPLHLLLTGRDGRDESVYELAQFLLKYDRGAITTPNCTGNLPLHIACQSKKLSIVQLVFDSYPEAIHERNCRGRVPLDHARMRSTAKDGERSLIVTFLEQQLRLERQAHQRVMQDDQGQLPIHQAMSNDTSPGTIKLMILANPNSMIVADHQGSIPLHIACRMGNLGAVKYLIESNKDSLKFRDADGASPLHCACRGGNCAVINYILDQSSHGASMINSEGKLPIQSLLFDAQCDRDDLDYVEAVGRLLCANPAAIAILLQH